MKRKILIIAAIVLAAALVCICTLPIKTVDTLALPGGQIDFEGNLISEETTTLVLTRRNYLFRGDTIEPEVTFSGTDAPILAPDFPSTFLQFDGFLTLSSVMRAKHWQSSTFGYFYIANDLSWYLIRIDNSLYFGSAQGGPSPAEIIAMTHMTDQHSK